MCGICGIVDPGGADEPRLKRMARAIAHRGPDDEGFFVQGSVGLGNRRLSIIDLGGGHQPISNEDGSIWVVFNGEIYNYRALRARLIAQGHQFRTESDTEVLVHLYEELGEQCVTQLRGMFAIALWDERQQKLLLARDHLGQKPLFYATDGNSLLFASEIKALLAARAQAPRMDLESVHDYLSLRFIPPPRTMLHGIQKLPPAHCLTWQAGIVQVERYWQLTFQPKADLSDAALIHGLEEELRRVIQLHLVSDVPVGAFLSGGMDSSMVVALMAQETPKPFKTFAIGVAEQDFSELPYARMVADRYATEHVEESVQADLIRALPRMIWHLDEPSDPIAACQYHAAALAAGHVKVVLGGDGGDELFAGFDRYMGQGYIDYYAWLPRLLRQRLIGPLLHALPDSFAYKSTLQQLRWVHQLAQVADPGERYAEATCFFRFSHAQKQALFGPDIWRQVGQANSSRVIARHYEAADSADPLDRMLYADYMTRLPEHSLMLTDRMTMAHGLELRSPFLDHELVAYMAAMPSRMKIRGRELKYILRLLGKRYLPEAIVKRPKQGFMFPIAYWFRNELRDFVRAYLGNAQLVRAGIFRHAYVTQLLDEHDRSRTDHHVRLWMLLNMEIWHQLYIEGLAIDTVQERLQSFL